MYIFFPKKVKIMWVSEREKKKSRWTALGWARKEAGTRSSTGAKKDE